MNRFCGTGGIIGASLLLILHGCIGGKSPSASFYTLGSLESSTPAVQEVERDRLAIGIGSVGLPGYLDRPQIVVRKSAYAVDPSEYHRWAEPLEENFERALAENLSILLNTDRVYVYPKNQLFKTDYEILVDVARFDCTAGGNALLKARWVISKPGAEDSLTEQMKEYQEPLADARFETMVAAQSRTLGKLSSDIAHAIAALAQ